MAMGSTPSSSASSHVTAISSRRWPRDITIGIRASLFAPSTPSPEELLCAAAESGDAGSVAELLTAGADPTHPDASGLTPLMHAVVGGHAAAIRLLLDVGVPCIALSTSFASTCSSASWVATRTHCSVAPSHCASTPWGSTTSPPASRRCASWRPSAPERSSTTSAPTSPTSATTARSSSSVGFSASTPPSASARTPTTCSTTCLPRDLPPLADGEIPPASLSKKGQHPLEESDQPLRYAKLTRDQDNTATTTTSDTSDTRDLSSLLSTSFDDSAMAAGKKKRSSGGVSSIPSGVRLENTSKSYKGVTVLKDVSWEVQRGEKVGLVGVNGAGKTAQLRIMAGLEEPDGGNVVTAKENMKIAFLSQEFEVCASRTVREEFLKAEASLGVLQLGDKLKKVQKAEEVLSWYAEKHPENFKGAHLPLAQISANANHFQITADALSKIPDIQHMPTTVATLVAVKEHLGDHSNGAASVFDSAIQWWKNAMTEDNKLDEFMREIATFKLNHVLDEEACRLKNHGFPKGNNQLNSTFVNSFPSALYPDSSCSSGDFHQQAEKFAHLYGLNSSSKGFLQHYISDNLSTTSYQEKILMRSAGVNSVRTTNFAPSRNGCNGMDQRINGYGHSHLDIQSNLDRLNSHFVSYKSEYELAMTSPQLNNYSVDETAGRICMLAKNQNGCRFLQKVFTEGTQGDVEKVFAEIIDHIGELMVDPLGNYLVQKLLEECSEDQMMCTICEITKVPGELIAVSCNMHGTRAVQKVIETITPPDQISKVVAALSPGAMRLMTDINGSHVAHRCLPKLSPEYKKFLLDAATLRYLKLAKDQLQQIMLDQYGNYVIEASSVEEITLLVISPVYMEHADKEFEEDDDKSTILVIWFYVQWDPGII